MQIVIKDIVQEHKVSKNGKAFVSCRLQVFSVNQGKDVWLSGFGDTMTETWAVGDTVDIEIVQNGEYFNWQKNENTKASPDRKLLLLQRIESKLDVIIGKLNARPQENAEIAKEIAREFNGEVEGQQLRVEDLPF